MEIKSSLDTMRLSYAAVKSDGRGTTGEQAAEIMANTAGSPYPWLIIICYRYHISNSQQCCAVGRCMTTVNSNVLVVLEGVLLISIAN